MPTNKKPNKKFSNKKKPQNTTHPYTECIQAEISQLKDTLKTLEELEELSTEQQTEKVVTEACLQRYQDTLNKMTTEPTLVNKLKLYEENEAKKKDQPQILTLLQLFYLMRLGQLGLFQHLPPSDTVSLDIISDVCDQIIGAAVHHATEPTLKAKAQNKTKVFDLIKKLDSSSEDAIHDSTQTTFKQVKDFLIHLWENTSITDKNDSINQGYSIIQFESMVHTTSSKEEEDAPVLSNSTTTTTHEEDNSSHTTESKSPKANPAPITTTVESKPIPSATKEKEDSRASEEKEESKATEEKMESNSTEEISAVEEQPTTASNKGQREDAKEEPVVEPISSKADQFEDAEKDIVEAENSNKSKESNQAKKEKPKEEEAPSKDTKDEGEWSKEEKEVHEKKNENWKSNEETSGWSSFDSTLKNDGWGNPGKDVAQESSSADNWEELKKKFSSDIADMNSATTTVTSTHEPRDEDWRRRKDYNSGYNNNRGRGRGIRGNNTRGTRGAFRGNNTRGKPRGGGGMSRGRGTRDDEYGYRHYSNSRQQQE